jgi:pimeloyl-ACP methyl ester carboxylesterase
MIPPMEIITRCRARKVFERRELAGNGSVEFKMDSLLYVPEAAEHTLDERPATGAPSFRGLLSNHARALRPVGVIPKNAQEEADMNAKSLKSLAGAGALAALMLAALPVAAEPAKSGHVKANGINYYYEVSGKGEPLLLLHGGLGSTGMFAPILPALTDHRQVIAIDLHGHGRTELGSRKISLIDIGNDVATVLDALGYKQVDVLGYSFGGGVGFRLAVQHPQKVRRIAIVSAGFSDKGFFDDIRAQQNGLTADAFPMMKETPMYQSYAAVAPKPDDFPRLLQAMGDLMREHYDFSSDVKKITAHTMIVFGDGDMYKPEHIVEFYKLLGGGLRDAGWGRENLSKNRLAIIPDQTHYDLFFSPKLIATALPFLDGVSGSKSWQENVQAAK